jgi:Plasmid encoded RepA protein
VELDEKFYTHAIATPIPIDLRAVRGLKQSPMALDTYFWLTYKMYSLNNPFRHPILWDSLREQIGCEYPGTAKGVMDFRKKFTKHLQKVLLVYPKANVEVGAKGITLSPSPTHVPKRMK